MFTMLMYLPTCRSQRQRLFYRRKSLGHRARVAQEHVRLVPNVRRRPSEVWIVFAPFDFKRVLGPLLNRVDRMPGKIDHAILAREEMAELATQRRVLAC